MSDFDNPGQPYIPDWNEPLPEDRPKERQPSNAPQPAPIIGVKNVTRYNVATGKLLGKSTIPDNILPVDGQDFFDGHDPDYDTQYIEPKAKVLTARLPNPITIDTEAITLGQTATINNVPPASTFTVHGLGDVQVDDGELVITPSSAGEYEVGMDDAQYLQTKFNLVVTE